MPQQWGLFAPEEGDHNQVKVKGKVLESCFVIFFFFGHCYFYKIGCNCRKNSRGGFRMVSLKLMILVSTFKFYPGHHIVTKLHHYSANNQPKRKCGGVP
jgi:hypothetical protein